MFIKAIFGSYSCASAMLQYSGPAVVELLGSSGGRHVALAVTDCVFMLESRHLGFAKL